LTTDRNQQWSCVAYEMSSVSSRVCVFAGTAKGLNMKQSKTPALSLILCSRSDQYMGNSRWRLEQALNYFAKNAHELDREEDVEVIVADWGSETPLREVLHLSPIASKIVSFVIVPPEIARELQRDSPFPEVLALNAAARRVKGRYIGRIDQDTLVGKRFLRTFFELHDGTIQLGIPLESVLLFANRRSIPYRFAARCPSFWIVDQFVRWFGGFLRLETSPPQAPFYVGSVGIWLVHRNLWDDCGGYDEEMIYMGGMEVNMIARLMKKYKMVDLGKLVSYDFYHLEHHHPWTIRSCITHRSGNPNRYRTEPRTSILHPNSEEWGLARYPLEVLPCSSTGTVVTSDTFGASRSRLPVFILFVLFIGAQMLGEWLLLSLRALFTAAPTFLVSKVSIWRRRARIAWETIRGQPFVTWPHLLRRLWAGRNVQSLVYPTNFHTIEPHNTRRP